MITNKTYDEHNLQLTNKQTYNISIGKERSRILYNYYEKNTKHYQTRRHNLNILSTMPTFYQKKNEQIVQTRRRPYKKIYASDPRYGYPITMKFQ